MKEILKHLGILAVVLGFVFGGVFLANYAMEKNEIITCHKLQDQACEFKDNENYYITQAQYDVCKLHGFDFVGTETAPINVSTVRTDLVPGIWYYAEGQGKWVLNVE